MKSLKYFAMMALVLAVGLFAFDALAQTSGSTNPFQVAVDTLATILKNSRIVIYVTGAFGLIAIAVGGIIGGKIAWKWLAALAMGLGIIAVADYVVTYATQGINNNDVAQFGGFDDGN